MILFIECIILCLIFFLMCFLGTGNDDLNLKGYDSYPNKVKELINQHEEYMKKIKKTSVTTKLISNFVMFLVILFVFGIFIRTSNYLHNFLSLVILGETLNLFDLLVIDILWYRNSKRTKLSKITDKNLYMDVTPHVMSFLRAVPLFIVVAAIDGALLLLF